MPRGPAPAWRQRKPPVLDSYVLASVEQAGGLDKHNAEGHYGELVIDGLKDRDEAQEYSRALYRSAHYLNRTGAAAVSMSAKIERDGDGWRIRFKAISKAHARAYVLKTYGNDRTKWAYNPRNKGAA